MDLLVDTGAQHSDIFSTSTAGQKLAAQSAINKEPMYTASGKISARMLKRARVTAGAFSILTDVDVIAGAGDSSCPRDGVLAMDVLRSCALLLGAESDLRAVCGGAGTGGGRGASSEVEERDANADANADADADADANANANEDALREAR